MKLYKDIASFNEYLGLPKPLDNYIDYYDISTMRLKSEPVLIDFYRIAIKSNFIDKSVSGYDVETTWSMPCKDFFGQLLCAFGGRAAEIRSYFGGICSKA